MKLQCIVYTDKYIYIYIYGIEAEIIQFLNQRGFQILAALPYFAAG